MAGVGRDRHRGWRWASMSRVYTASARATAGTSKRTSTRSPFLNFCPLDVTRAQNKMSA